MLSSQTPPLPPLLCLKGRSAACNAGIKEGSTKGLPGQKLEAKSVAMMFERHRMRLIRRDCRDVRRKSKTVATLLGWMSFIQLFDRDMLAKVPVFFFWRLFPHPVWEREEKNHNGHLSLSYSLWAQTRRQKTGPPKQLSWEMSVTCMYHLFIFSRTTGCWLLPVSSQKHQSKLAITKLSPPSLLTHRKTDHGLIRALLWFLVITPGGWQSLLAVSACFFQRKESKTNKKQKQNRSNLLKSSALSGEDPQREVTGWATRWNPADLALKCRG